MRGNEGRLDGRKEKRKGRRERETEGGKRGIDATTHNGTGTSISLYSGDNYREKMLTDLDI